MKKGTRVYRKSAPFMGVGTVIFKREDLVEVRWDLKGLIRVHSFSALQPSGVPVS